MKVILLLIAALGVFGLAVYNFQNNVSADKQIKSSKEEKAKTAPAKNKTPVLVELFTSEGCATCPPADRNLAVLEREQPSADAEIITLALHVDYWNGLGWTDEFSSPLYSQRQQIYGQKFQISQIYTPQMVVDGVKQFVGSNLEEAQKAINDSARTQKAKVELSFSNDKLKVKISDVPKHENAAIFVAIAEDDISTEVKKGENGGRTLQHTSVVRSLKPIGRVLTGENNFEMEIQIEIEPKWKPENLKIVAFLQENQSRRILGVNSIKINKN